MLQLETASVVTCCELEVKAVGTDGAVDEEDDCWSTSIWFSSTSNTYKKNMIVLRTAAQNGTVNIIEDYTSWLLTL